MKVTTINPNYILLKPVKVKPSDSIRYYLKPISIEQLNKFILNPCSKDIVAVDLETRGLDPHYKHEYKDEVYDSTIMGMGFAWRTKYGYKSAYIDLTVQSDGVLKHLCERLPKLYLIAHNAMFDGTWLRYLGQRLGVKDRPNWVADTFGLFKQLAGQDFEGQGHGLKDAQVNLLGWDAKGDVELDEWLVANGYYTESGKKGERKRNAVKGEMWRVPVHILGKYCALDCISTLQLFDYVFEPVMNRFKMLWDYHEGPYIRTIQELIDQKLHGVRTNVEKLKLVEQDINSKVEAHLKEFYRIEELRPHLEEHRVEQIEKIKKPEQFKKNGEVSKNWLKYEEKIEAILNDPTYKFNTNSGTQLKDLFYNKLYSAEKKVITYNRRDIVCYDLKSPRGQILLPATDSGAQPTDKHALPWLGEAGRVLNAKNKEDTSLSTFVKPYIKFATTSSDGRMHPGWIVPQAVTGRLGGSKPNFQQITGDPRILEAIEADPGYIIVEKDWAALEDYVAANVTKCPGLLNLYGPDAKPNDGHLWLGSQLPNIGPIIIDAGYDRDNPTQEMIDHVKSVCKKERDITKAVKYSATYGIGAFKLWQDFMSNGVEISLETTAEVLRGYWDVFIGMKEHKWYLKEEWERNRGWIYNAIGRPMSVGQHHLKDLFSRSIQGGGHDLQMMFGMNVADAVKAAGMDARPFVYDLHDATYWQVKEDQLEDYLKLSDDAAEKVWEFCKQDLGWTCRLKTSAAYGRNLKELKGY